jgi:hypothetical protein
MVLSAIALMLFSAGGLSVSANGQRVSLPVEVVQQLEREGVDRKLRVRRIDLNRDGHPELIVQGACAVVGNCSTWVFRKGKGGYEALLRDGEAQIVKVGRRRQGGYRDLILRIHDSAFESTLVTYSFDADGKYRETKCVVVDYSLIDSSGRLRISKDAKIRPCGPENSR